MGVINYCECGKILTKEETEYKDKHPCSIFFCSITKTRKNKK